MKNGSDFVPSPKDAYFHSRRGKQIGIFVPIFPEPLNETSSSSDERQKAMVESERNITRNSLEIAQDNFFSDKSNEESTHNPKSHDMKKPNLKNISTKKLDKSISVFQNNKNNSKLTLKNDKNSTKKPQISENTKKIRKALGNYMKSQNKLQNKDFLEMEMNEAKIKTNNSVPFLVSSSEKPLALSESKTPSPENISRVKGLSREVLGSVSPPSLSVDILPSSKGS